MLLRPCRSRSYRIKNPLADLSPEALDHQVTEFVNAHGLGPSLETFKLGARLAQNPHDLDVVPELESAAREAIINEKLHKWRQPRALYLTIITCSIGAAVQ
jgi:hypothetical protein